MQFFRKSGVFTALLSAFIMGAAEIPWFNQDFENRNFFSVDKVQDGESASAGKHTGFTPPCASIVMQDGSQAFRLERIGTHRAFNFSGLTAIPAGRDFILDFDLFMPGNTAVNMSTAALNTLHSQSFSIFRGAVTDTLFNTLDPIY